MKPFILSLFSLPLLIACTTHHEAYQRPHVPVSPSRAEVYHHSELGYYQGHRSSQYPQGIPLAKHGRSAYHGQGKVEIPSNTQGFVYGRGKRIAPSNGHGQSKMVVPSNSYGHGQLGRVTIPNVPGHVAANKGADLSSGRKTYRRGEDNKTLNNNHGH